MLEEPRIHVAIARTAVYTIVTVAGTTLLALVVALFLNEAFRGRRILATLLLVPWATPSVVNGLIWKWIYDSNYGALNGLLKALPQGFCHPFHYHDIIWSIKIDKNRECVFLNVNQMMI